MQRQPDHPGSGSQRIHGLPGAQATDREGVEAVLSRKPRATPSVPRIFDGEKEAKLIALACSEPPKGRARWTLRLLENKVVELNIVDSASDQHDWADAQKNILKPHLKQQWVIPPQANSAFVAAWRTCWLSIRARMTRIVLKATRRRNARAGSDEARTARAV
jgi:hypothetical protein